MIEAALRLSPLEHVAWLFRIADMVERPPARRRRRAATILPLRRPVARPTTPSR